MDGMLSGYRPSNMGGDKGDSRDAGMAHHRHYGRRRGMTDIAVLLFLCCGLLWPLTPIYAGCPAETTRPAVQGQRARAQCWQQAQLLYPTTDAEETVSAYVEIGTDGAQRLLHTTVPPPLTLPVLEMLRDTHYTLCVLQANAAQARQTTAALPACP
jgi:hypothetical protein